LYVPLPQIWLIEKENFKIVVYDPKRMYYGLRAVIKVENPPEIYAIKDLQIDDLSDCLFKKDCRIRFRETKTGYTVIDHKNRKLFALNEEDFRYHIKERACLRKL
jgi:hypothetical protein